MTVCQVVKLSKTVTQLKIGKQSLFKVFHGDLAQGEYCNSTTLNPVHFKAMEWEF